MTTTTHSVFGFATEIGVDLRIASTATTVTIRASAGDDVIAETVVTCRASTFDFAAVRDVASDRLLRELTWITAKAQQSAMHRRRRWLS